MLTLSSCIDYAISNQSLTPVGGLAASSTLRCRVANWVHVGAAEGCDKVGTTFSGLKKATGSRSIAASGSSYISVFLKIF